MRLNTELGLCHKVAFNCARLNSRWLLQRQKDVKSRFKRRSTGKIVFSLMTSFTGRYQDILYTQRGE